MGRPIGPRKVHHYSVEFKLTAVKLSGMPEVVGHHDVLALPDDAEARFLQSP